LEQESYYINGKKNGISEKYYENGNIKSERNYMEEKGDGNHKGECPYKWEYFAKKLKKEDILKKYCEKENMQEAIFCMIEKTEDLCICYH
jgi:antitoxin component YwqK of YwqJK toxin-antitoxin module